MRFEPESLAALEALLGSPERCAAVTSLVIKRYTLGPKLIEALAAAPLGMGFVSMREVPLGDEGLAILATSRWLCGVGALLLEACGIGDEGVAALATGPAMRLRSLHLANYPGHRGPPNRIGDAGARALAAATRFVALEELDLTGNPVGAGCLALAESPSLVKLQRLIVWYTALTPDTDRHLRDVARARTAPLVIHSDQDERTISY